MQVKRLCETKCNMNKKLCDLRVQIKKQQNKLNNK